MINNMPRSSGSNRMAQYARNASADSGSNGDSKTNKKQSDQRLSDTPQLFSMTTRQAITESAKLPPPKPFTTASPHRNQQAHTGPPQIQSLPMRSPPNPPDMSPPRQHHQRTNSRGSDATAFWPESHIDSQFGSPTTQRSDKYDTVRDTHSRSPPPALEHMPRRIEDELPFIISKDGKMRIRTSNQAPDLPAASNAMLSSAMEVADQPDAYSSEPIYKSPTRRPTKLSLHHLTSRRSYAPPTFHDDQEVFSDPVAFPSHCLKRIKKENKAQGARRLIPFQEDEEVEGSLASEYSVSEDDRGTPRPGRKTATPGEHALLDSSMPALARNQQRKTRKRRHDSCDYADDELAGMNYSQLREQPFDDDPTKKTLQPVGPLTGDSLPVKLDHFKSQREAEQMQFFRQMTVSDWERSGDWFLEQFGQIAHKLKQARRNKRDMVEQFEEEIASREEAVRLRTENITKKLEKIKHKGEDMLADKEI